MIPSTKAAAQSPTEILITEARKSTMMLKNTRSFPRWLWPPLPGTLAIKTHFSSYLILGGDFLSFGWDTKRIVIPRVYTPASFISLKEETAFFQHLSTKCNHQWLVKNEAVDCTPNSLRFQWGSLDTSYPSYSKKSEREKGKKKVFN